MASAFSLYSRREAGILSDTLYWKGARDCVDLIQRLKKTRTLVGHQGCVNTIAWNNSGSRLVSGADDRYLKIYDTNLGLELHSVLTTHQSNIFSARFLSAGDSSDVRLVSCAGIGSVEYSEISPVGQYVSHPFQCNRSITYQVAVTPGDSNEFMTCEEKGYVRLYDLRVKSECSCDGCKKDVLYSFPAAVSSMAVHPISPYYLAFGLGDGSVQLLDRRMISNTGSSLPPLPGFSPPPSRAVYRKYSIGNPARKITSIQFNQDGSQLLASYSEDYVYLFNSRLFGCGANSSEGGGGADGHKSIVKPSYFSDCECHSPAAPRKRKSRVEHRGQQCGASSCTHGSKTNTESSSKEPPVMKKLRLRGDWSDTGPEASPEAEGSESHGRNLMNHMSRMFAQWIDMSLSSDEQGREGGGGGPLGPGLDRARRRISERRRRQMEERGEGASERGARVERRAERLNSSSSSSNSFSLFDDKDQEMEESGESRSASESATSLPQHSGVPVEAMNEEEDGGSQTAQIITQSSGEATANALTTANSGHSNSRHSSSGHSSSGHFSSDGMGHGVQSNYRPSDPGAPHRDTSTSERHALETSSSSERVVPVVVENRSLDPGVGGGVPSINVIEDETDSDDDNDGACDRRGKSCDQSCDCTVKVSRDEGEDHYSGKDSVKPFMVYKGHRNARTMIKQANFFGERWVLSGSDCGRIFVWDKWTGQVVNMLLADSHVVNCIQPHPHAYMIATSGIDYDVKLWEPVDKHVCSLEDLNKVIERNQAMLEESRNTITMPSMIFLRVLSYLNRSRRRMQGEEDSDPDGDS